jgi:hypothetical protein
MAKPRNRDVDKPSRPAATPPPPKPKPPGPTKPTDVRHELEVEEAFELGFSEEAAESAGTMAIEERPAPAPAEGVDFADTIDVAEPPVNWAEPLIEPPLQSGLEQWVRHLEHYKRVWPLPQNLAESFAKAKRAFKKKYLVQRPGSMVQSAISSHPHHNIMGVGIGRKWTGGFPTGEPALIILVRRKFADADLVDSHRLPREIGGVATDVIETGRFCLFRNPRSRWRPHQPGCSIGPENLADPVPMAGTFGAIVRDRAKQQLHLLSAAHVLTNFGGILDPQASIFQPSLLDFGTVHDVVGQVGRCELWTQHGDVTLDAGIATLLQPKGATNDIPAIGQVAGIAAMHIDDAVEKVGRTTSYRQGAVIATGIDGLLPEGSPKPFFGQTLIRGTQMIPFADFGDSGSLVVAAEQATRGTKPAVGLLVAGNADSVHAHYAVATPIQPIMDALEVDMA